MVSNKYKENKIVTKNINLKLIIIFICYFKLIIIIFDFFVIIFINLFHHSKIYSFFFFFPLEGVEVKALLWSTKGDSQMWPLHFTHFRHLFHFTIITLLEFTNEQIPFMNFFFYHFFVPSFKKYKSKNPDYKPFNFIWKPFFFKKIL